MLNQDRLESAWDYATVEISERIDTIRDVNCISCTTVEITYTFNYVS